MSSHIPLVAALFMIGAGFSVLSAADPTTDTSAAPVQNTSTDKDQSFVNNAAEGGLFEVQSSRIALDKNIPDSVRDFAKGMISDHTQANDKLVALAHAQGYSVPDRADLLQRMCLDKLSKLDGDKFVKDYDRAQLKAHDDAISLFEKESRDGRDPAMKSFASDTLPVLRHHREMVNGLPYIDHDRSNSQSGMLPMGQNGQAPANNDQTNRNYQNSRQWNDKRSVDSAFPDNSKTDAPKTDNTNAATCPR